MPAIIAFGGGVVPLVRQYLIDKNLSNDFIRTVGEDYDRLFQELKGENVSLMLPTAMVPTCSPRFQACSDDGYDNSTCDIIADDGYTRPSAG